MVSNNQLKSLKNIAEVAFSLLNESPPPIEVKCPMCGNDKANQVKKFSGMTQDLKAIYMQVITCSKCKRKVTMAIK